MIVDYYGLPAVSMKDVWFPKWARNQYGFRQRDVMCGTNHPNYLGHKYALSPPRIFQDSVSPDTHDQMTWRGPHTTRT